MPETLSLNFSSDTFSVVDFSFSFGSDGGVSLSSFSFAVLRELLRSPDKRKAMKSFECCSVSTARKLLSSLEKIGFVEVVTERPRTYALTVKGEHFFLELRRLLSVVQNWERSVSQEVL